MTEAAAAARCFNYHIGKKHQQLDGIHASSAQKNTRYIKINFFLSFLKILFRNIISPFNYVMDILALLKTCLIEL